MDKKALRQAYKQKRKQLSADQIIAIETSILEQLQAINFDSALYFHVFLPIKKQLEINTYPIIDYLKRLDKKIIISRSNFDDFSLEHFIYDNNTQIALNAYGIPEPVTGTPIAVNKIDVVLVPLLISDRENYRVGYGKGFYDRFLTDCRQDIQTIGINYFAPIDKITDRDAYDIALDRVIYPK